MNDKVSDKVNVPDAGILDKLPWLMPIQHQDQIDELKEAAAQDHHNIIAPSHVAVRGGEIVGYVSLAVVPLVVAWMDSRKVRARESLGILNTVENILAQQNRNVICMPCAEKSPFRPYMRGLGYIHGGESGYFFKTLRG